MRTRDCTPATIAGRLDAARQFRLTAESLDGDEELGNAYVTNCVHAGIAAADVICCSALGHHAQGDNHSDAIALLKTVRPDGDELSKHLATLLALKSKAGYGFIQPSREDRKRAGRAMDALVERAQTG
jgi:hypothetical protein